MKGPERRAVPALVLAAAFLLAAAVPALAQGSGSDWEYKFTVYGWLPRVEGTLNFDVPGTGNSSIRVYPGALLDNLQSAMLGAFSARRGRWGFAFDALYMKEGFSGNDTVAIPIGKRGVMVEVGAAVKMKAWVIHGVGTYTAFESEGGRMDLLFGVRYMGVDSTLKLNLERFHPVPGPYRSGELSLSSDGVNGIVGIKGEVKLGNGHWFMPYYLDGGAGDADFTWQAMVAAGYRWEKVDLTTGFRYLSFDYGGENPLRRLEKGGPFLGLTFRW